MLNSVFLTGRMTKDPELRYTGSGTAVATFTIAVERDVKNQQGEREVDFINCVCWRQTAEYIANNFKKGKPITIKNGRIQNRSYDGQDGKKVYITEIVFQDFDFALSDSSAGAGPRSAGPTDRQVPQDPFAGNQTPIDISDDDLPF